MKQLLVDGSGPIYQICRAFRNGEIGSLHNPEFTILEWYEIGIDHHQLMHNLSVLVRDILGSSLRVEKQTYQDLFISQLDLDPLTASLSDCRRLAANLEVEASHEFTVNDWLDFFIVELLQKNLGAEGLYYLYDYPASQAALARLNDQDERVASRFELYYQGVELANGYHELTDPLEQRQRFEKDNRKRREQGQQELPIDEQFLAALERGMPECAGVALGLDRLLMLKMEKQQLSDVLISGF